MKKYIVLLAMGFVLFLTACGNNNGQEETDGEGESTNTSDPIIVSGQNGVELDAVPERVIAPYMEDTLVALGVKPVAQWAIGDTVQNYLQDDLEGVEKIEWDLPPESVLSHDPDLIILSALDSMAGQLEDYENIAPTYVFEPSVHADLREQVLTVGKLLDKEDEAEERLAAYDEHVTQAKETLSDEVADETVAMIWVSGDQYFMFEEDRHAAKVLYQDVGLTPSDVTKELGEAGENWDPISLEKLSELQADHLFLLGKEDAAGMETLENSSIYQNLPAVQNEQVYHIEDQSNWTNKGIIAYEQTLDEVVDVFTDES
ncbi:ferrichrome ABC transporter substrate-binding protein [Gracilibacillus halophilus YIM-C55.5]|uniref:Ferrichrome ABC transporter substrate-binding protein n=1 Tax=Gracilibacillus halophilus YIM-C55.5 TaxID=1308866 RepID=N4WV09_9BACI|nr:ABC transporter substrate-binding protein [Gracilibacillus halophilus]ENH98185.1 ferrichrome ABC transporter substrate-binding protein [Gracilibacillus halophilus YIM-C55.5]